MKSPLVLSFLFTAFVYSAQAQVNPVLVSDVVKDGTNIATNHTKTIQGQVANYSFTVLADYGTHSLLAKKTKSALFTTSSSGLVDNVIIEWVHSSGLNQEIIFYGKDNSYTTRNDLYDDNRGVEIGRILRTSRATPTDYADKVEFSKPYFRYFGMAVETDDVNLTKITVTWKLAYSRENVTPDKLGTICLPYNVEKEQLEGVTLYDVVGKTSTNEKEAIVCEEVDHIEAGKPYLFTSTSDALFLLYSNESSYTTEQKGTNGFYGNFTATTAGALRGGGTDDIYVVSGNAIKKAGDAVNIGANRAYIRRSELPVLTLEPASQRRYVLTEDGFAPYGDNCLTSGSLLQDSSFAPSSSVYDVHGRRVSATHRGIVVQEGRVVLH